MNLYLFVGGGYITADGADMFVDKMRDTSLFCKSGDVQQYMSEVADRCLIYSQSIIRIDSTEHFLQDLIDNNFVVKVGE